jgi:hypoxanthine phosphoribosyltransferase
VTHPAPARVLIGEGELRAGVHRIGQELSAAYPEGVLLVAVLKGSAWFLADLVRAVTVYCPVDFLAISSYAAETGRVKIVKDLDQDILDKQVVLVEDIVDTGLTLSYVTAELRRRGPRSLEVCALLDKRARRLVPTPIRFSGFEVPDEFLLGYGLDYDGRYRNLPEVVAGDLEVLRGDPDAYVQQFYGG